MDPSAKEFLVDAGVVLENLGPAPIISASLPNLNNLNSFLSESNFASRMGDSMPLAYKFSSYLDSASGVATGRGTPIPSDEMKNGMKISSKLFSISQSNAKIPEKSNESLPLNEDKQTNGFSSQIPSFASKSHISKLGQPQNLRDIKKPHPESTDSDLEQSKTGGSSKLEYGERKDPQGSIPAPSSLNRFGKYGRFIRSQNLSSNKSGEPSKSLSTHDLSRKDTPEMKITSEIAKIQTRSSQLNLSNIELGQNSSPNISKLPGLAYPKVNSMSFNAKPEVNLSSPLRVNALTDQTKVSKLSPKPRPKSEHITYQVSKLAVPKKSSLPLHSSNEMQTSSVQPPKPVSDNSPIKPYPALPKRRSLLKPPTDIPAR